MGIITRFLARKVERVVETAVETAVVLGAGSAIVAADEAKRKKDIKKAALENAQKVASSKELIGEALIPTFQLSLPENSDRKQKKIVQKLAIPINTINENARIVYDALELLGQIKLKLFNCFIEYVDILKQVEGLPENIEVRNRYEVDIPSFIELTDYLRDTAYKFPNNEFLNMNAGAYGFIKKVKSPIRFHTLENKLAMIEINKETNADQCLEELEKLNNFYRRLLHYLNEYVTKLNTCYERYIKLLNKIKQHIKKNKAYNKLKKFISSSYLSTILILDLINTSLMNKNDINAKVLLEKMNRMIIL